MGVNRVRLYHHVSDEITWKKSILCNQASLLQEEAQNVSRFYLLEFRFVWLSQCGKTSWKELKT
jgi:hypothetical protein